MDVLNCVEFALSIMDHDDVGMYTFVNPEVRRMVTMFMHLLPFDRQKYPMKIMKLLQSDPYFSDTFASAVQEECIRRDDPNYALENRVHPPSIEMLRGTVAVHCMAYAVSLLTQQERQDWLRENIIDVIQRCSEANHFPYDASLFNIIYDDLPIGMRCQVLASLVHNQAQPYLRGLLAKKIVIPEFLDVDEFPTIDSLLLFLERGYNPSVESVLAYIIRPNLNPKLKSEKLQLLREFDILTPTVDKVGRILADPSVIGSNRYPSRNTSPILKIELDSIIQCISQHSFIRRLIRKIHPSLIMVPVTRHRRQMLSPNRVTIRSSR